MSRASDASARIADRLLARWTLTARACPVETCKCPLMCERPDEDEIFYCAAADARVRSSDRAHGASERRDAVDVVEDVVGASDGVDGRLMDAGRAPVADASGRVAEKLLEGWTLTGATCPMTGCHTPLVRNREGEMFCARHELYVREAGATARAEKPPAGTAAANARASASVSAPTARAALSDSELRTLRALEAKADAAREAFERETDAARARDWLALLDDAHACMRRLGAPRDG